MVPALTSNLKQLILEALGIQPGIELAIVFGSIAVGGEQSESYLDLALDAGHALSAEEKVTLISELAARIGRPVDLVDLQTVGEPLLGQILKHGSRILGSNASYAGVLRRHLFNSADFLPYRQRILRERRQAWIGK